MFGQAFDKSLVDRARTYRKDAIRPRRPRSYQRLKSHRIQVRFISTFQIAESMGFKANFASGNTYCGLQRDLDAELESGERKAARASRATALRTARSLGSQSGSAPNDEQLIR